MMERILIPLDGSAFGSRAIKYAGEIARRFDAEIVLLQVITPAIPIPVTTNIAPDIGSPTTARMSFEVAQQEDKRNTAKARKYLQAKVRGIKSDGIKASYLAVVGDPAQSIMKAARKEHIDLIVMTTHGKSGIKRALLGSVADEVIRNSRKPVLVVRPQTRGKK